MESVRAKLEDTSQSPEDADVPLAALPRVQAVIAERLTQLSAAARDLAGVAAAVGTAFSCDLLTKVTDWNEESVMQALDELWRRRMVETQPRGTYDFSHDRLREVAYSGMSPVRRRFCHGLHDHDTKFCASFRSVLAEGGVKTLRLPARNPNRNAFAQRWVRSVKEKCLSKLILFGEGPLSRTLAQFRAHHHGERNHQSKGNKLLSSDAGDELKRRGPIVECHQRLGGLLKYYRRAA